jgi:hypothetical protein
VIGRGPFYALVATALFAAGAAFAAGTDLSTALPLALLATAAAALAASLALVDRLRWRREAEVVLPFDPPLAVRDALRGSELARQALLVRLRALERHFGGPLPPLDEAEERRVLALARGPFQRWVGERISALERAT